MGKSKLWLASLLGSLLGSAGSVQASSFTVNPIKVQLSDKEQSALLTLQNQSTEELRFKILVQQWKQTPQGEMQLADTNEVVVYPAMLNLPPSGERKLRVGTTVRADGRERAYRVFVEELPPLRSAKEATKSQVRVLTKMGIPIFIRPANPAFAGTVEGMRLSKSTVAFTVRNKGNVHFLVQKVHVKASDGKGSTTFEKDLEGWYVLSGETRVWQLDIPKAACEKSTNVSVAVETVDGRLDGKWDVRPAGCGP